VGPARNTRSRTVPEAPSVTGFDHVESAGEAWTKNSPRFAHERQDAARRMTKSMWSRRGLRVWKPVFRQVLMEWVEAFAGGWPFADSGLADARPLLASLSHRQGTLASWR